MSAESDMNDDLKVAIQTLAADNARLCAIAKVADDLAEFLGWLDRGGGLGLSTHTRLRKALDAYKVVRNGG